MRRLSRLLVMIACGALVSIQGIGCERAKPAARAAPTPGYAGSVPAPYLQDQLRALKEQTVRGTGSPLPDGEWTVVYGFAVVPHPAEAGDIKEPHAALIRRGADPDRAAPEGRRYIRISTDEEARAFIALVRPGG